MWNSECRIDPETESFSKRIKKDAYDFWFAWGYVTKSRHSGTL